MSDTDIHRKVAETDYGFVIREKIRHVVALVDSLGSTGSARLVGPLVFAALARTKKLILSRTLTRWRKNKMTKALMVRSHVSLLTSKKHLKTWTGQKPLDLGSEISDEIRSMRVAAGLVTNEPIKDPGLPPSTDSLDLSRLPPAPSPSQGIYASLPDSSWFRLLVIESGTFSDPLVCRLVTVQRSLAELQFETISYAWKQWSPFLKEAEGCIPVRCNGAEVDVSLNLRRALRRLRLRDRCRVLWADSLCINQEDNEERSSQVKIMDKIYSSSSRTIVWLGEAGDGLEAGRALDLVCRLITDWDTEQPACYSQIDSATGINQICGPSQRGSVDAGKGNRVTHLSEDDMVALSSLFTSDWFSRLWVIQEVVCSRTAEVHWAGYAIAWHYIGLAAAILRIRHPDFMVNIHLNYEERLSSWDGRNRNEQELRRKERMAAADGVLNAYTIFTLAHTSSGRQTGPLHSTSFLHLLRLGERFMSSKTHDKVFALLGLPNRDTKPGGQRFIEPNYALSDVQLYTQVAERLLASKTTDRPLKFLADAEQAFPADRRVDHGGDVPTWIPRWVHVHQSRRSVSILTPWALDDSFSPGQGLPFERFASASPECLMVRAVELSTIVWISKPIREGGGSEDTIRKADLINRVLSSDAFGDTPNVSDVADILSRTLCAGRNSYGSRVKDGGVSLRRNLFAFMSEITPEDQTGMWYEQEMELGGNAEEFRRVTETVCFNRRLIVTAGGHVGLATHRARPGDAVFIFGGADMPFAMRPRRLSSDPNKKPQGWEAGPDAEGFYLVGECFIDGIMEGEAIAAMNRGEGHRGPVDGWKLIRDDFGRLEGIDELRGDIEAIISKARELAEKKYEKLTAVKTAIY